MTDAYYNRLHLNFAIEMLTYNPNTDKDISINANDVQDTYESLNVDSSYEHTVQLLKNDADVEIIPATLTGVKFCFLRVLTENLAVTSPANGTINIKITSSGAGTDQLINADLLMRRSKNADITSIKITSNEDDTDGVTLPVLIILGGIKS